MRPEKLLQEIYSLIDKGDDDDAADILFSEINHLCREGKFSSIDEFLKAADPVRLNSRLMVSIKCITMAPAKHLKERDDMLERFKVRLKELIPDRYDNIMKRFY